MLKIVKAQFTDNDSSMAFINNLNCPILSAYKEDNVPVININNIFTIKNYINNGFYIYTYGTQTQYIAGYWSAPITTIIYDDNMVYLMMNNWWNGSQGSKKFVTMYDKINNDIALYGYKFLDSSNPLIIEDIDFYEVTTGEQYRFSSIFKSYVVPENYIDYTEKMLFKANARTTIMAPNFLDCSNITPKNVITFNGKNYYTIGNYSLVEVEAS